MTNIVLPELTMPTDEDSRSASAEWLKPLRPCLYTYWPERYKELSFDTQVRVVTPEEMKLLCGIFDGGTLEYTPLHAKIANGIFKFTNGCFFKLESRSPKDNYWGEATNFRACSFYDVQRLLYSERILDDLARYRYLDEPLRLLFREWHPIRKSGEFRCFIKDRKLAGISQYHHVDSNEGNHGNRPLAFADIYCRRKEIGDAISRFIATEIIPHLPVDDLVVDLWIDHTGKFTLIEINPYGLSDPCLFTYAELEKAEGEFRIVEPTRA